MTTDAADFDASLAGRIADDARGLGDIGVIRNTRVVERDRPPWPTPAIGHADPVSALFTGGGFLIPYIKRPALMQTSPINHFYKSAGERLKYDIGLMD